MSIRMITAALALAPTSVAGAQVPSSVTQVAAVEAAAADFISAFNALDETRFDGFWTEDATLFFPGLVPGVGGGRIAGKADVLKTFHAFFAAVRKAKGAPPYLNIRPQRLAVQAYGDTAIVTFELDGENAVGRRTLVMRRAAGRWRIAHMHASSQQLPKPAAAKP